VATTPAKLMTFAEFEQIPGHSRGLRYELRHGEPVLVPPPKHKHHSIRLRLRGLLEHAAGDAGVATMELGFRPVKEHEYRIADVAFVPRERWDQIPGDGYMQGAPDLVVEVYRSPTAQPK
jgi:Uma2 family endonuclease